MSYSDPCTYDVQKPTDTWRALVHKTVDEDDKAIVIRLEGDYFYMKPEDAEGFARRILAAL